MTNRPVLVSGDGLIGRIILDRPQQLNALSDEMLRLLIDAGERLSRSSVRVVVISGNGSSFSAGYDVAGFDTGQDSGALRRSARLGGEAMDAIAAMRPVTIAALHGHVIGGAVVLAAACDLRVAADDSTFSIPEIDLGIPLAWGGIARLVSEIGPGRTKELVMTGRVLPADEALRIGLVNRVVPAAELEERVTDLAATIAAKPALPIDITKRQVAEAAAGDAGRDEVEDLVRTLEDEESATARHRRLASFEAARKRRR